jgi:DNA-binding CsgD family transcriptional regulator
MTLDEALGGLDAGPAKFLEIAGEPGIGKTRLLGELSARARARGHLVLSGRAVQPDRGARFGVVIDAVDHLLTEPDGGWRDGVDADCAQLLATVFPSLSNIASDTGICIDVERHRLHLVVRTLLERLARPQGLVLILDDVHWADDSSVELLAYLLRHPPDAPALLALAYRPRQVSPRLASAMVNAAQEGSVRRLDVAPLSADEADQLLGQGISGFRRRALYRDSGGNPLYLQALAHADSTPSARARRASQPSASTSALATAHTVLRAEIDALSSRGQLVAHAAAVVGDPFEPEVVAAVADQDQRQTLAAIDELLRADLVRPAGTRRFRFRHPLVREAAYAAAGGGWRVAAHARAAEALAERGASAVARAHHLERAAHAGDEAALGILLEAAAATATRAPATAARWVQAALDLLPADDEAAPRRLELSIELARALGVAGQLRSSRATLHEVLRLLPPGASPARAKAVAHCAMAERMLGQYIEAMALLQRELAVSLDERGPETALLTLGLAIGCSLVNDFEASGGWAGKAAAIACAHGDRPLEAAALAVRALAAGLAGDVRAARVYLDQAAALVDPLPDGELAQRPVASLCLGWAEICLERCDDGIRHLERTLALVRSTGQGYILSHVLAGLSRGHQLRGRLGQATAYAEEAVEAAVLLGSDDVRGMALGMKCVVSIAAGDVDGAVEAGEQAVATAAPIKGMWWILACCGLAHARLAAGDPTGCIDAVAACGGPGLVRLGAHLRAEMYELFTRAELARGRPNDAKAWAVRAEAVANGLGLDCASGFAQLARAHTLLTHDPASAAECAAKAASLLALTDRVAAGRAHEAAGGALAAAGELPAALTELGRAEALFATCGAHGLHERVVREQRRLGRRLPRDKDKDGPWVAASLLALTKRELQVAEFVRQGQTNRQIARALSLSPKTVETHLARAFGKLGVTSRAALASAVAESRH